MISAVIFDMDGLLFDTEHKWQEMERAFAKRVGIEITPEMQKVTLGLKTNEMIRYWYNYKPWADADLSKAEHDIEELMRLFYLNEANLMKGAMQILEFFKTRGIRTAIASSSPMILIDTFLEKFKIQSYFEIKHSAEYEEFGKPHPGVFITTARLLNIHPSQCLVFEDSFNGLLAGKSALMKTVVVPETSLYKDQRFVIADMKLRSLVDFGEREFSILAVH
jgi:sugar-phosphatase